MSDPVSPAAASSAATQRELLVAILDRAAGASAGFVDAMRIAERAGPERDPRRLARELLSDLGIRGWIELWGRHPDGALFAIARTRFELELSDDRNWVREAEPRVRYSLSEKGEAQRLAMRRTLSGLV